MGRERVVFYYLAEKRVDFRELVKDLARVLRTRIEMRQIGVRDEAKLLADYGDCGKPVCCNTHLTRMPPVSMKMAKIQKTTLDPAKISGRCGRSSAACATNTTRIARWSGALPPVGSKVVTAKGRGRVVAQEILAQKLVVEFEDQRRIIVGRDDILSSSLPRAGRPPRLELDDDRRLAAGRTTTMPVPGRAGNEMTERRMIDSHELSRRAGPDHRERSSVLDRRLRVCPRGAQSRPPPKAEGQRARSRQGRLRRARPRNAGASSSSSKKARVSGHVTGRELCEAVRKLALRQYGLLAAAVLESLGSPVDIRYR